MMPNPACETETGCGVWSPPMIKNPNYKGKWRAPLIPNPAYKGTAPLCSFFLSVSIYIS